MGLGGLSEAVFGSMEAEVDSIVRDKPCLAVGTGHDTSESVES